MIDPALRLLGAFAVLLALPGCSFVVSGIELPAETTADGALDTGTDAAGSDGVVDAGSVDAQVDANLDAGFDAGPDMSPADLGPLDMMPPDMMVPDAGPPPLARYAGEWHVYGAVEAGTDPALFAFVIRVLEDGSATMRDFRGELVGVGNLTLREDQQAPGRVEIIPVPFAGLLTGVLDPQSGLGTFVNDAESGNPRSAFAMVVRRRDDVQVTLPDSAWYLTTQFSQPLGAGEAGQMGTAVGGFLQSGRVSFNGEAGPDQRLTSTLLNASRYQLTVSGAPATTFVTSPDPLGHGFFGMPQQDGDQTGLLFGWRLEPPFAQRAEGGYFCAGFSSSAEGEFVARSVDATLSGGVLLNFADGANTTMIVDAGIIELRGERGFFDIANGIAMAAEGWRGLFMLPMDTTGALEWGFGLCIAMD